MKIILLKFAQVFTLASISRVVFDFSQDKLKEKKKKKRALEKRFF